MKMDFEVNISHTNALRNVFSNSAMGLFMEVIDTGKENFYPKRDLKYSDWAFGANLHENPFEGNGHWLYFKVLYPERLNKKFNWEHVIEAITAYCKLKQLPEPSEIQSATPKSYMDYEYPSILEPEWDEKGSDAA